MIPHPCRTPSRRALALLAVVAASVVAARVRADVAIPFREDWAGTSVQGWGGGATVANPGTGGADGAADGYLKISRTFPGNLGARTTGSAYIGDWIAAGVTRLRLALSDVGSFDPGLQIHVSVGSQSELWQYNLAFVPPAGEWETFEVDLTNASRFTRIIGSATFAGALQNADRVLIRHDAPAFVKDPDDKAGDFGVDRLELLGDETPTRPASFGSLKAIYRDRSSRR